MVAGVYNPEIAWLFGSNDLSNFIWTQHMKLYCLCKYIVFFINNSKIKHLLAFFSGANFLQI